MYSTTAALFSRNPAMVSGLGTLLTGASSFSLSPSTRRRTPSCSSAATSVSAVICLHLDFYGSWGFQREKPFRIVRALFRTPELPLKLFQHHARPAFGNARRQHNIALGLTWLVPDRPRKLFQIIFPCFG